MARGNAAENGETNTSANGYHYTKRDDKWRLTHHLIAEEKLGRKIDTKTETVRFKDKNRQNLDPSNIIVIPKRTSSLRTKIARLEATIEEKQAELKELKAQLERKDNI